MGATVVSKPETNPNSARRIRPVGSDEMGRKRPFSRLFPLSVRNSCVSSRGSAGEQFGGLGEPRVGLDPIGCKWVNGAACSAAGAVHIGPWLPGW